MKSWWEKDPGPEADGHPITPDTKDRVQGLALPSPHTSSDGERQRKKKERKKKQRLKWRGKKRGGFLEAEPLATGPSGGGGGRTPRSQPHLPGAR